MTQKLVTFSDSVLRVDASTIYECWKSGDIVDVRLDGQTYFIAADFLSDLVSEGLIHQDGLCGKGWGGTTGFCKRLKRMKYMQSDRYSSRMKKGAMQKLRSMKAEESRENRDHQDGICGKGWTGTQGFCKRVKKIKDRFLKARDAAFEKERSMTDKERIERTQKEMIIGGVVGATAGLLTQANTRRAMGRGMNNFARKAGESAGRAASKYKRRGSQVSKSIGALPPGFRTIMENL